MARLSNWWRNVSIAKKIYLVVGIMAFLIVGELLCLQFATRTLSAARAFVTGEGLWSKSQKNAAICIHRFGLTQDEHDYQLFLDFLDVPQGDRQARLELTKPNPDLSIVRSGFLRGQIHPNDIDPMIDLIRRFHRVSYIASAIKIWTRGDELIGRFKEEGIRYHEFVASGNRAGALEALGSLQTLNEQLTSLENDFSYVLGEGSRWLEYLVLVLLSAAVMIVETVGLTLTFMTSRAISRGLTNLNDIATRIGQGRFYGPVASPSKDEIGQLTRAVVAMGETMRKSQRQLELRVRERTSELLQSGYQLEVILKGISDGITVIDRKGQIVYANETAARMYCVSSLPDFLNSNVSKLFENFEILNENLEPVAGNDTPSILAINGVENPPERVLFVRSKITGEERWLIVKSAPVFDETKRARLAVTILKDFTEHKRNEDSMKFLDEANRILSSSLEYEKTVQNLADLLVPQIADWCSIYIIDEEGQTPRSIAVAHHDPQKLIWAQEYSAKFPPDWTEDTAPARVLRTGKSELIAEIPDERLVRVARNEEHLKLLREIGMKAVMVLPLTSRGKVFGIITLTTAESEKKYTLTDLAFAEELARRASMAIDNAHLYKKARRAVQVRNDFLSIAAHELRTPLTSLKLQLQMTKNSIKPEGNVAPTPERLAKVFDVFNSQVNRLTNLIEDIMSVSQIQTGTLNFNLQRDNLSEVVEHMVSGFFDRFIGAHCPIDLSVQPGVSAVFDRPRIEQALDILMSNVLEYAPGKPVKISLSSDEKNVRFSIADGGPGIPRDLQPRIFERLEQETGSKGLRGLGLGLYIVKEIIKGHNGSVSVQSEIGLGAKFTLELPISSDIRKRKPLESAKELTV